MQQSFNKSYNLTHVKSHNDFSLRNILISHPNFGIIDWDSMIYPKYTKVSPIWSDLSFFLINLQSMYRFFPLISRTKIIKLRSSFIKGYFEGNTLVNFHNEHFSNYFYIFTLKFFFALDRNRTLPEFYRYNLGPRFIQKLKTKLLSGSADILL